MGFSFEGFKSSSKASKGTHGILQEAQQQDHRYSQAPANAEEMEEDCSQAKEQQQEPQIPQENSLSLSLSSTSSALYVSVPKGFLALCVGEEMKRFVIPMEYLSHRAFGVLLREAEEEFGFEQGGVLRIPCDVCV